MPNAIGEPPTNVSAHTPRLGQVRPTTGQVLTAVADHFTAYDPTETLDEDALLVCVCVSAYDLSGQSVGALAAALARAALAAAPDRPAGITRGEYALRLRKAARVGHDWSDDDNKPVIPRIPGPRAPKAATGSPAPRPGDSDPDADELLRRVRRRPAPRRAPAAAARSVLASVRQLLQRGTRGWRTVCAAGGAA